MNRGVWIGALAVGVVGLLSEGRGQVVVWRPLPPRQAPAVVRGVSDDPGASIGRPVAIARAAATDSEPLPFPTAYQNGAPVIPPPASLQEEPIAAVAPPGAVIATSVVAAPPLPPQPPALVPALAAPGRSEAEEPPTDLFAADRGGIAAGPGQLFGPPAADGSVGFPEAQWKPGQEILPVANWESPYPVGQPPAAPPPDADPLPTEQPVPRFYLKGEYLLWWVRRDHAPPLATTGDAQQGLTAGSLGMASTVVLDNGELTHDPRSGGRFTAGYYLDCNGDKAVEVTGFFLGKASENFSASSAQFPVLARPFFNLNMGTPFVESVAFPGASSGTLTIHSPSELGGLEANLRCKWCCGCDYQIYLIGGPRFLDLRESVMIVEDIQTLAGVGLPNPFNGTHFQVVDSFATSNQFYGGQVGVEGLWQWKRFTVEGMAKLALGVTEESLDVNGAFHFPPGTPNVSPMPGGLLALNSNSGHFTRSSFSVVPEVGVKLGYYLTEHIRATVGYDFLYWSSVVRPGEQIDPNIDITRIPNFATNGATPLSTPHPAVLFKETDFWAQGLTFGIEFTY